jgi:hypothetical protein
LEATEKIQSGSVQKIPDPDPCEVQKKDPEHSLVKAMYYGPACPETETNLQSTRDSNTPPALSIVINPASDPQQAILLFPFSYCRLDLPNVAVLKCVCCLISSLRSRHVAQAGKAEISQN